eukprot:3856182-Pyramimonas_sp.AAC.1
MNPPPEALNLPDQTIPGLGAEHADGSGCNFWQEGIRILNEGKLIMPDSFPGNERNKLCMSSKVQPPL